MVEIELLEIDPDTAEILRTAQDIADAMAYAFAVPSMCAGPVLEPVLIGIDWAKGYGVNTDNEES